jgi:hypothetical protein
MHRQTADDDVIAHHVDPRDVSMGLADNNVEFPRCATASPTLLPASPLARN